MAERVRVRVAVHGRVQGVFFRVSCAREARSRGVAGGVRNRPDGSVEAVFEGDGDGVAVMVEWCRHGPAGARVERIEVDEEPPTGATGFTIER